MFRLVPRVLLLFVGLGSSVLAQDAAKPEAEQSEAGKELFTGQVQLLGEALKQRGVKSYEEMHNQAVLVTPDGELIPIVADWRGRAFFQDKKLRNRKVELIGSRKPGVPYLQVTAVYTFDDKGRRMYTDYWCDTCAIPMYEIKPCDCCQGENRLRFQPQDLPAYLSGSKKNGSPAEKTGR